MPEAKLLGDDSWCQGKFEDRDGAQAVPWTIRRPYRRTRFLSPTRPVRLRVVNYDCAFRDRRSAAGMVMREAEPVQRIP